MIIGNNKAVPDFVREDELMLDDFYHGDHFGRYNGKILDSSERAGETSNSKKDRIVNRLYVR